MSVQPFFHANSLIAVTNAEYGIRRLQEKPEEYVFYLRGTLAALKSVPDYILEEANQNMVYTLNWMMT